MWRERSRVAGEPEPAGGQPRCAPTRLPEAAGLREAVTPAGRAGQSGARPSRQDGKTGAPASARVGDGHHEGARAWGRLLNMTSKGNAFFKSIAFHKYWRGKYTPVLLIFYQKIELG